MQDLRHGGAERILTGDTLTCVDTALGRMAVCICLDFLQDGNQDLMEALKNSEVTIFMVPAMSPGMTQFEQTAKSLGRTNQACALVANSGIIVAPGRRAAPHKDASFIYIPDTKTPFLHAMDDSEELLGHQIKVNT